MRGVDLTFEERRRNRDFPPPPIPKDFAGRLGRLEDRSGDSLEEFARRWRLPQERAWEWRCGEPPTALELRSMMEWACSLSGGMAVLLTDCSHSWPVGRTADGKRPLGQRMRGALRRLARRCSSPAGQLTGSPSR